MCEKRSALLVIDVQVGPLWGTYKSEETFSVFQQMIAKAEEENIPVFYINSKG